MVAPSTLRITTLASVAVLVGTEIFGVAFAAGWAIAGLFELGPSVSYALMALFGAVGLYGLFAFMRTALRFEAYTR